MSIGTAVKGTFTLICTCVQTCGKFLERKWLVMGLSCDKIAACYTILHVAWRDHVLHIQGLGARSEIVITPLSHLKLLPR